MAVLVTGASGFFGRNFVRNLLENNIEVYAFVSKETRIFNDINTKNLHVFTADLSKDYSLQNNELISRLKCKITIAYHFAWYGVKPEERNSFDIQTVNLLILKNFLRFANEIKVKKIILPGSTCEYYYSKGPINKVTLPSPNDYYGCIKTSVRLLASNFCRKNKIDFCYAVITGIYSEDRLDNNVITYTIRKLLNKEKPILSSLEQKWDYVYLSDAIAALFLIGLRGKDQQIYAVGHGDNWPLSNYIFMIRDIIDPNLPLGIGELKQSISSVLPNSTIDLNDLMKDTGFVPKVDFNNGIKKVIKKISDNR